ncbi:DNRLRE domain-containing protein [Streptomyces sp. NRRL F-5630]|uniref:DNRLRE domain-containing protein n=1 Tax=Streptomyces sp. NRRL F-5630 TaxID=1463864 RepID=UPI00068DCAB1|nr:DNRLRE domain-containing protein [Streptomyces sp. NRRL F-5630]
MSASTGSQDGKAAATSADSIAAALLMARTQGRKIEAISERTETATTYALPTGELQTIGYAGPVRQKDGSGRWQDIDTSLSDTGAALEPDVAAADIRVSDGGDTRLASVSDGEKSFAMRWDEKLPTPTVKDDTARYDIGDGQILTVTALSQGFAQNVLLSKAPADPLTYRIPIEAKGLQLSKASSGRLLLKDSDGKLAAEAPAPMMWDSSKDERSGESKHLAEVETTIETAEDGSQTLVLSPDPAYFERDLTYPVTVDPTSTLAASTDTWVATNYNDSQVSSTELKSGTYDAGTTKARSYLKFDVTAFKGKHITDTNLALYSDYSSTCATTGAGTQVRQVTADWSSSAITWAAQPATTATGAVTNKAALGWNSSCPAGTVNFDIDAIVQSWAGGAANYGLRVAGASETDSTTWRRFRSANYVSGDGSSEPHLTVTYNSYPAVPASNAIAPAQVNAYNGKRYVTSLNPTLSAKVTDPDGSKTKAEFEVTPDPAAANTTYTYTGSSSAVTSGSTATLTVPGDKDFPAGAALRVRARAHDGTDYGPWSGYTTFQLNTVKPVAPAISCEKYAVNSWSAKSDAAVNCTLNTESTDGAGYFWGLDNKAVPNKKLDTTNGSGGDALTVSITPDNGWHTLYAKTVDSGGNISPGDPTAYSFGVGADGSAVTAPSDGDATARRLSLSAKGKASYTGVTWQYRRGESDGWHTVPVADVTVSGDKVTSWPVKVTDGEAPKLVWNMVSTLAEDGVIELRAAFTDGTTTGHTQTVGVTLDRDAGTALITPVGPGEVNELTGDFTLTGADASAFDASVGRTYSSRANNTDTEGQADIFGPGWTSSVTSEASDFTQIRKTSDTSVELLSADGSAVAFTIKSDGSWAPQAGAEARTLTGTLSGPKFTLTDTEGNTTVFTRAASTALTWTLSSSATAVDDTTVTTVSETVTASGKTLARPRYVISPTGAVKASTCQADPATKGCRILEYVYASTTTATGSTLGDYTGQVKAIKLWATNPGAATATAETVASYAYAASGNLRQVWDPRTSPALKTDYGYDADGRVIALTSPGELPWTFTYGKAGSALTAGEGMLMSASRPALAKGTKSTVSGKSTTTVVYDVPLSGASAPYPMDADTVATWAQDEAPTDATAIFPATSVPAFNTGSALKASDYGRATISYLNANGEESNNVSPGGAITTSEYDLLGNEVASLTAANRALALGTSPDAEAELAALGLTDLSTAERAQQLGTVLQYSADGTRLTDEYGPLNQITLAEKFTGSASESTLAAGTVVQARAHTSYTYDQGAPADAAVSDQVTSSTTGAAIAGYATDADTETTTTTYDWSTGAVLATTGGGESSSMVTVYDDAGRVATTRTPGSTGADAGTLKYTYYDADTTGACASVEWDGLLCKTTPAATITGGGSSPDQAVTTVYAYGRWGQVVTETESANGVTRTTTTTADPTGRPLKTTVTGGAGTSTPATVITYDASTGQVATTTTNGQTSTTEYDALGRTVSYSDGAGNTTSYTYDILDRPVTASDSAPSTTSYTYDDTTGQALSVTDSVAGTSKALSYDADGALTGESLPGGYNLARTFDTAGSQTSVTYTDSEGTTVLSDSATYTIHGKQAGHAQTDGGTLSTAYEYDAPGRLALANDDDGSTTTSRAYAFDADDNRTSLTTTLAGADGTATTSTKAYQYDTANRLTAEGHTYDAFGRTTKLNGNTLGYYANDLVASETAGDTRTSWGLDAAGRLASSTTATTTDSGTTWSTKSTTVNHYSCGCDTPSWTVTTVGSTSAVSCHVSDLTGGLAVTTSATGDVALQLANLHGDISVQMDLDTATATVQRYDEYGNPLDPTAAAAKYGSLGAYQRATDGLAGYTLMGVRMYDPATGRFLQADPVYGGNTSTYVYPADPIGQSDTSGELKYRTQTKSTKNYTIGISRNCNSSKAKCSLTWYVKLKAIWKKHGSLKFVYSIVLPLYNAKKNQNYGHLEPGTYTFHGSWGVPNGKGRPESDRGKYKAMGMTFWFDWTDNVEFSGKFTVQKVCVKNPTLNVYGLFT